MNRNLRKKLSDNCTIIDLHDRSVIAGITDRNITADLAKRTLKKAILSQPGIDLNKLMIHSEFTSIIITLRKNSIRQLKNLRMYNITMCVRIPITTIKRLMRHAMGLHKSCSKN